eukprot:scaffold1574_cov119-Isochrysis_galbana.AAC.15
MRCLTSLNSALRPMQQSLCGTGAAAAPRATSVHGRDQGGVTLRARDRHVGARSAWGVRPRTGYLTSISYGDNLIYLGEARSRRSTVPTRAREWFCLF